MLYKMMDEAGKKLKGDEPLAPEDEIALGNEYNNRGWELQTGENPDIEGAMYYTGIIHFSS